MTKRKKKEKMQTQLPVPPILIETQQEGTGTNFHEIITTFITEGIKAVATSGMSLGATLQQLSIKGAMKQSMKNATRQGLKKNLAKAGKVAGRAAVGTAEKLDNKDDNQMELTELGVSMLTKGRG